jgi:hypothetical protein
VRSEARLTAARSAIFSAYALRTHAAPMPIPIDAPATSATGRSDIRRRPPDAQRVDGRANALGGFGQVGSDDLGSAAGPGIKIVNGVYLLTMVHLWIDIHPLTA